MPTLSRQDLLILNLVCLEPRIMFSLMLSQSWVGVWSLKVLYNWRASLYDIILFGVARPAISCRLMNDSIQVSALLVQILIAFFNNWFSVCRCSPLVYVKLGQIRVAIRFNVLKNNKFFLFLKIETMRKWAFGFDASSKRILRIN